MSGGPPKIIVCNRIDEASARPISGSTTGTCDACEYHVILSPSSLGAQLRYPGIRVLCVECALDEAGPEGIEVHPPSPEQEAELASEMLSVAFAPGTRLTKRKADGK